VTAWPPVETDRLADALAALAERVVERDVRAQLHALGAVLRNLGGEEADMEERRRLADELAAACAEGDEPRALAALRELAALDRGARRAVDWSAVTGG
jgi:hypothetical protein